MLQNENIFNALIYLKNDFIAHFNYKDYSKHTIESYSRILETFCEYSSIFKDEMSLIEINSIFLINFLNYIDKDTKKLSKSTKKHYLTIIKIFFKYINENHKNLINFEKIFKNVKINGYLSGREEKIVSLNNQEIILLENELERGKFKECYNVFRNALLVKLMLFGGLRISEALNVKLCDFTENTQENLYYLNIPHAKGDKAQIAYIPFNKIEDEILFFRNRISNDDYIMKTNNGKLLNRSNAFLIVNRIYKKAKINKQGLHILRHSLAVKLTEADVNLAIIKKILRHSNITTTTIYAKATTKGISEALNRE
ncbi:recombinase XerC [Helicobacter apodemus]|uniref:Recombinase XerC n=1 Tax=Helicobacter apodemus TaxID=135569 RepID=A0A4U8UD32_9HELI|nr:tyrosine-type recombinase/integrase [Helicobacter apodemus]TLE13116.1 recombinase XerC [Helicobacter apodemus]